MLAGQIGLNPPSMTLVPGGWEAQLKQSWKNAAAVLDAVSEGKGGRLSHCFGALVYINSSILSTETNVFKKAQLISHESILNNSGVTPGYLDGLTQVKNTLYDGYEDEETAAEVRKYADEIPKELEKEFYPILVIAIPEVSVFAWNKRV